MKLRVSSVLLCCTAALLAQRQLEYDRSVVSQVRIDARDLGYPPADVIPSGESAITALVTAPSGALYGATSGKRSHLFVLEPRHGYVQPLGYLQDVTGVSGALAATPNGDIYIGAANAPGHLLRYTPHANDGARQIRVHAPCETKDLGVAVEHEGIFALESDPHGDTLYGITSPNGYFFTYDISQSKFATHGRIAEHKIPGEKFETELLLGRALIADRRGFAFTSGEGGALLRFDPATKHLDKLPLTVPTAPGREPYNRVDAWTIDAAGVLYGGSSDGYIFRLDPEILRVENLGKPLNQYRIRGLVFARNGKLYGAGGDDDEMARLFSYDAARGVYEVLGFIDVNRRPYYTWQAYRIGAMALGRDGTIYLGESERKSRLYLYFPE